MMDDLDEAVHSVGGTSARFVDIFFRYLATHICGLLSRAIV